MNAEIKFSEDCIISKSATIESGVIFGRRVIMGGDNIVVRANARLDAACVIGEGVTIGQGAWVRAGAVVLSSIPPNSIVEGNPAHVVGYRNRGGEHSHTATRGIDIAGIGNLNPPACVPLGIGNAAVYLMRKVIDARGSLTVGEVPSEVPFSPVRYFAVFGVPSIELRGEHAHKRCQQFLICLHGSCRILLDDGIQRCEVTLDRPDLGVFMPEMIWGTQYRFTSDAVMLVFASRPYEDGDYIRSYDEFLAEIKP